MNRQINIKSIMAKHYSLLSILKTNISTFLTILKIQKKNMALGFDPLQSEPKLKRIKKSLNEYSCPQCEYIHVLSVNIF